jgi:predicted  nucleic acid-binding Zn-ribbon protein
MMKINRLSIIGFFMVGLVLIACNPVPTEENNKEEAPQKEDLKEQSDSFDKSMENVNDAMDLAKVLNEKIQLVEKQFEAGQISREKADKFISDLNTRYAKAVSGTDEVAFGAFPDWLTDLNISEPKGLTINSADSYQTLESNMQDGYNSVLIVYNGTYEQAMAEAQRIAKEAHIPLSEPYQKAKDLAEKLGQKIEGVEGVTYVNYKFGEKEFDGKYKISLSVDKAGKLTIHVVDERMKNARKNAAGSVPKY